VKKALFLLLFLSSTLVAKIEDPRLLLFGTGIFNIVRNTKAANFQLEYRSNFSIYRNEWIFIRPLVGAMGTTKGSTYFYGGIAFDLFLGKHVVFTPSFAPGIYIKGGGMELGLPLEFRSAAELAWRFNNKSRFGAMFYHMSNASLGYKNPGTECLVFYYALPLGY